MKRRCLFVIALLVTYLAPDPVLRAQEDPPDREATRQVIRVVQDASRALQGRNAALFLRWFERERFKAYATLETHVVALTTQSEIASSIDIVEIERTESGYRLRVDWLLQLSVLDTPGPLETRRDVLRISAAETKKGKWRITALDPVELFRPQGSVRAQP